MSRLVRINLICTDHYSPIRYLLTYCYDNRVFHTTNGYGDRMWMSKSVTSDSYISPVTRNWSYRPQEQSTLERYPEHCMVLYESRFGTFRVRKLVEWAPGLLNKLVKPIECINMYDKNTTLWMFGCRCHHFGLFLTFPTQDLYPTLHVLGYPLDKRVDSPDVGNSSFEWWARYKRVKSPLWTSASYRYTHWSNTNIALFQRYSNPPCSSLRSGSVTLDVTELTHLWSWSPCDTMLRCYLILSCYWYHRSYLTVTLLCWHRWSSGRKITLLC